MNIKIVRKARQKNRLHHYRSQIVALKAQLVELESLRGMRVGPFFMVRLPSGNLFVETESGEGGGFEEQDLLPYLRDFWREKF